MVEPILDLDYWAERMRTAKEEHHAIYRCPLDQWRRIEDRHRQILAQHIRSHESVLDAGCGWGRLLDLMPKRWIGGYCGVDLSPDFIATARCRWPIFEFHEGDLRNVLPKFPPAIYEWGVMISMRPMVKRNLGDEVWAKMEAQIRRVARRLLYLEYDEADRGSIE